MIQNASATGPFPSRRSESGTQSMNLHANSLARTEISAGRALSTHVCCLQRIVGQSPTRRAGGAMMRGFPLWGHESTSLIRNNPPLGPYQRAGGGGGVPPSWPRDPPRRCRPRRGRCIRRAFRRGALTARHEGGADCQTINLDLVGHRNAASHTAALAMQEDDTLRHQPHPKSASIIRGRQPHAAIAAPPLLRNLGVPCNSRGIPRLTGPSSDQGAQGGL